MKTVFVGILLIGMLAQADMYYECTKQSESESVNDVSGHPRKVQLDIAKDQTLYLNGKKVGFELVSDEDYKPVLKTQRIFLGEMEVAYYSFDGRQCDSRQVGTLFRRAEIGAHDVFETAEYTCECGED